MSPRSSRRAGDEYDEEKVLDAPCEQGREPEAAAYDEVHAPDDRFDDVDALEQARLPNPAWKRVPRAGQRTDQRPPNGRRDETGDAPGGVHQHRLREVDGRTVREEPDGGLNGDDSERDPNEQGVTACPPLVHVDEHGDCGCRCDPGAEPTQLQ